MLNYAYGTNGMPRIKDYYINLWPTDIDNINNPNTDKKYIISINDTASQFPKWYEAWKEKEDYQGKYKYIYMGFGNGLSVDNSIYNEFEPYLNNLVSEYLKKRPEESKEELKYAAVYNTWEEAFINMANDKGYILKK